MACERRAADTEKVRPPRYLDRKTRGPLARFRARARRSRLPHRLAAVGLALMVGLSGGQVADVACSREAPTSALDALLQQMPGALPIPTTPLPGQRRTPCPRPLREAAGGCWQGYAVVGTDEEVAAQCATPDVYELAPGSCVRTKRLYLPVFVPKPNSVK